LGTSLGVVPAQELGHVTNSTVHPPFVFVVTGVTGLVNESNLHVIDVQHVEVGKTGVDSFPTEVDLHVRKLLGIDWQFKPFFEKNHSWVVGT